VNFSWFRDLQAVQQLGSFSKASEARNLSQPALTRRIKALEVWAEQQLVERDRRPVTLTIAGQTLLETSIEFLDMLEAQRLDMLSQAETSRQNAIRFAAQHSIAWHFFPNWLRELELVIGPVPTRMRAEALAECVESLREQEVNFLLAYDILREDFPEPMRRSLEHVIIGEDKLVPVCAPKADGGPAFDFDSLSDPLPLVSYGRESPLGRLVDSTITPKLARHRTQVIYQNSMSGTLLNWTLRGAGVCWLPERLVAAEIDQGRLVLAAGEQWYVDLKIAIFSLPKTRFGLSADIWQHLKSDRVGLPPYDPHHG